MTTTARNAQTAALEALIEAHAIELKLPTVRRRFRALAAEATREQQTPTAYLGALLEAEMAERAERRERRRLIDARFPQIKRLEDFHFADNPTVPQATIAALAEGSWITDRESVIFIGDSGTGKTMLATALAVCACQQGRRVRFTTLAGLANELQEAQSRRELARVVARYARTELVVVDELGYLALPDGAAELVFQVLSERHERGSLIVTTNLPFGEWTKVFPDPRLAKAVVDRLTHRAHIIDTGTESWRFRHGLKRKKAPDPDEPARELLPLRRRPTGDASATAAREASAPPHQARSTRHNNRRQVGPLQAVAPGPVQAVVLTAAWVEVGMALSRWVGRAIGLDVHRDFCVVAICEDGRVRSAGRVPSTPEGLRLLGESLVDSDRVALEVTGGCLGGGTDPRAVREIESWSSARTTPGSVAPARRPTSSMPGRWRACCGVASLRRCGCRMSAAGSCVAGSLRREQLTRARTRVKNEIHACLARRLQERPPCSDLFGVCGER